jgi:hypothetical protein
MRIKLSEKEIKLLREAIEKCEIKPTYKLLFLETNNYQLEGLEDDLIDLRECCSDYLMLVGFDENYNPTEEGKILEDLIDKLSTG